MMEQSQNVKTISVLVIVLLLLVAGYLWFAKNRVSNPEASPTSSLDSIEPAKAVVENTPVVNGALSVPAGFPADIPIETGIVLESATTHYPGQNIEQLSVSYHSAKTVAQKYSEYKTYMSKAGYDFKEGDASAPVKAIFGTKASANLSVVVSNANGKTLVQLSYLLK